jgi:transposase
MAGKIKPMSQIKQLLQLHAQGNSIKSIARTLGISKNTVKSYLNKFKGLKIETDILLSMDEMELESKFHAGNPAYKEPRYEYLKNHLDYYEKELKKTGVTRYLLWEEYRQSNPGGYGYTQFVFHLNQQLVARKPSMVLSHEPGHKLFVDFAGKKLSYIDRQTGEIIECPVFVACLPHSDYGFAMAVRTQGIEDFIHALGCCLKTLGGSPKILVPDNLKSAVIKASRYEPELNQALEDFCNYYQMAIVPARVIKPRDKALVENQVKLVYTRVFAKLRNQHFFDLSSLNDAIRDKIKKHNQTRMQQRDYCREERFLANEKPLLQPLPQDDYEIKYYRKLKLQQNNHICLSCDHHYYSAPYQYIGQEMNIIYTRSVVRIYAHGQMVAIHPRSYQKGGYTTVNEHLCSAHQHYKKLSPAYYIYRAEKTSEVLHQVVKHLFEGGRPPEQNYKTCDGLLNLYKKTDPDIFDQACKEALECKSYSYRFILKIIENLNKTGQAEAVPQTPLPKHDNIRGKGYYEQLTIKF